MHGLSARTDQASIVAATNEPERMHRHNFMFAFSF